MHPTKCPVLGVVTHEIAHAMGLGHEQARSDRDQYVVTYWQNLPSSWNAENSGPYKIMSKAYGVGGPYDYDSIMQYGKNFFSINGQDTIAAINGAAIGQGQRIGLSKGDVEQVVAMYMQMKSSCSAGSRFSGERGCKDIDASCAGLAACDGTAHYTNCCACNGGIEYQCFIGGECTPRPPMPAVAAGAAGCIMDITHKFGGHYPCVFGNGCDYGIKIMCPHLVPRMYTSVPANGMNRLPPTINGVTWNGICKPASSGCQFEKV